MPVTQIDILLNVIDVERSLVFYAEQIGMHVDATWADDDGHTRWAKLTGAGGSGPR